MVRPALKDSELPPSLWAHAYDWACYTKNRLPHLALKGKTPYEVYFNKKPTISHLRPFGTRCFVHIPEAKRKPGTKLHPRAEEGNLVGYTDSPQIVKVYIPSRHTVEEHRHVRYEPYSETTTLEFQNDPTRPHSPNVDTTSAPRPTTPPPQPSYSQNTDTPYPPGAYPRTVSEPEVYDTIVLTSQHPMNRALQAETTGDDNYPESEDENISRPQTPPPPQSIPGPSAPRKLNRFILSKPINPITSPFSSEGARSGSSRTPEGARPSRPQRERKPVERYGFAKVAFEPTTYEEAMASPDKDKWIEAINEEIFAIMDNKTWDEYDRSELPAGRKAIGSRWVFKVKLNADGSVERFKARLVCKGYSQISGIDYDETFAPVSRYDSLRLITALAAHFNLDLHQLDIKTAFLNGQLDEEIWMSPPPGIGLSGKVLRLRKALYGLKQAPLKWYQKLSQVLSEKGFSSSNFDPCLFIHKTTKIYILVYVDDITIAGKHSPLLNEVIEHFKYHFKVTDKGKLQWLLGIEITYSPTGIHLSQAEYAKRILERFGMEESRAVSTPLDPQNQLISATPEDEPHETNLYQQKIGSLMYLVTGTRPDLAHAISFLSQFSSKPLPIHHTAVKRVFRYLNGSCNFKLTFPRSDNLELHGFSDASYGNNLDDRRSFSGYTFKLGNCTIAWSTKKQKSVAKSTTEAEYMALSSTVAQSSWYTQGFQELKLDIPVTIHCDNQSSISLVENPVLHQRTKHIDIHYHFTRERYRRGDFTLSYVPTADNLADIMTKGLPKETHTRMTQQLGLGNSV